MACGQGRVEMKEAGVGAIHERPFQISFRKRHGGPCLFSFYVVAVLARAKYPKPRVKIR